MFTFLFRRALRRVRHPRRLRFPVVWRSVMFEFHGSQDDWERFQLAMMAADRAIDEDDDEDLDEDDELSDDLDGWVPRIPRSGAAASRRSELLGLLLKSAAGSCADARSDSPSATGTGCGRLRS